MTNNPPSTRIQPGEYGFPLKLKARYDNFIGGDWVAPADGDYYQNLTPVTGQPLCEIASSGKRDIDLALDAAHKAKDKWGQTSVQDRAAILFKIADRMEQNLELLATAETWDNGKPIRETMAADVPLAIDHFRYFASCIRAQEGGISEVDKDTVAYHFHEPLGVVGQIIPSTRAVFSSSDNAPTLKGFPASMPIFAMRSRIPTSSGMTGLNWRANASTLKNSGEVRSSAGVNGWMK
jgi:aldehyde dehydrogenase